MEVTTKHGDLYWIYDKFHFAGTTPQTVRFMVDISTLEWVSISTNKHIWEAPLCVYYDRHSVVYLFAKMDQHCHL